MSDCFSNFDNHKYLGLIENTSDYNNLGVSIDGKDYVSLHIFRSTVDWNHEDADKKPWVLMFVGSDDISYYYRFYTEKRLYSKLEKLEVFDNIMLRDAYVYN